MFKADRSSCLTLLEGEVMFSNLQTSLFRLTMAITEVVWLHTPFYRRKQIVINVTQLV